MPILRNASRSRYTVITNTALEDSRLSWESRGVLAFLLSKPDGWRISTAHLQNEGGCGRDKILRIMRELRDAGYVELTERRAPDGTLQGKELVLHEDPIFGLTESRETRTSDNPKIGKADPLVKTEDLAKTDSPTPRAKAPKTGKVDLEPLAAIVGDSLAQAWRDHRRAMKAPVSSQIPITRICNALEACQADGLEPADALAESIDAGWKTVKPEWIKNRSAAHEDRRTPSHPYRSQSDRRESLADRAARRESEILQRTRGAPF